MVVVINMPYKDLGRMKDTPWHIGYVKKKENDPRRHKSRCSHYRVDGSCGFYSRFIGSAHCPEYVDVILQKEKTAYKEMRREERAQERRKLNPNNVNNDV